MLTFDVVDPLLVVLRFLQLEAALGGAKVLREDLNKKVGERERRGSNSSRCL